MVRVSSLRASDAERETTAERLRHATAEGRLTPEELEDRLGALYASRTYGELDALLADLPVTRLPVARSRRAPGLRPWVPVAAAMAMVTVLLGALTDNGRAGGPGGWHPDGRVGAGDLFGGAHHLAAQAASAALTILALVAMCAALVWVLVRRRGA